MKNIINREIKTYNKKLYPQLRRQTHMYCLICNNSAEYYNQTICYNCKSINKWSIEWKNKNMYN